MGSPATSRRRMPGEVVRIVAPLAILIGGIAGFVVMRSLKASPTRLDHQPPPPLVETTVVRPHEGGVSFSVDGLVVPYREIDLSAEVAGRVAKKAEICRAGRFVSRGTPLIEIDKRDNELEVRRLQRELAQADVMLEELEVELKNTESLVELAQGQLDLHRKELQRVETLAGKGYSTDSELDKTKRDELGLMNSVLTLKNQAQLLNTRRHRLESARELWQTQLEKAELDLARTEIMAPIDGVIVREMVEEDSFVQKGASLVKLEDTSAVEVRCNLRMDQLLWLWGQSTGEAPTAADNAQRDYQIPPAPVTVAYELAGNRYEWDGVLSRFDGIGLDEKTRTVPCRVLVSRPREVRVKAGGNAPAVSPTGPPALVRGMYVTVRVTTRPGSTLLEIPENALRPGNRVWQVVDGRLLIKRVQVAHTGDEIVLLHAEGSNLQPGAVLVSSPLAAVVDGMRVKERTIE